eukprot:gene4807-34561_t
MQVLLSKEASAVSVTVTPTLAARPTRNEGCRNPRGLKTARNAYIGYPDIPWDEDEDEDYDDLENYCAWEAQYTATSREGRGVTRGMFEAMGYENTHVARDMTWVHGMELHLMRPRHKQMEMDKKPDPRRQPGFKYGEESWMGRWGPQVITVFEEIDPRDAGNKLRRDAFEGGEESASQGSRYSSRNDGPSAASSSVSEYEQDEYEEGAGSRSRRVPGYEESVSRRSSSPPSKYGDGASSRSSRVPGYEDSVSRRSSSPPSKYGDGASSRSSRMPGYEDSVSRRSSSPPSKYRDGASSRSSRVPGYEESVSRRSSSPPSKYGDGASSRSSRVPGYEESVSRRSSSPPSKYGDGASSRSSSSTPTLRGSGAASRLPAQSRATRTDSGGANQSTSYEEKTAKDVPPRYGEGESSRSSSSTPTLRGSGAASRLPAQSRATNTGSDSASTSTSASDSASGQRARYQEKSVRSFQPGRADEEDLEREGVRGLQLESASEESKEREDVRRRQQGAPEARKIATQHSPPPPEALVVKAPVPSVTAARKSALTAAERDSIASKLRGDLPPAQASSSGRGAPAQSSGSALRLFKHGIDDLRLFKALEQAGMAGRVLVVDRLEDADAVIATRKKISGKNVNIREGCIEQLLGSSRVGYQAGMAGRVLVVDKLEDADAVIATRKKISGKSVNIREVKNAARNNGLPFLEMGSVSAIRVKNAARNNGLPFLEIGSVSAIRVMEAIAPIMGIQLPEHLISQRGASPYLPPVVEAPTAGSKPRPGKPHADSASKGQRMMDPGFEFMDNGRGGALDGPAGFTGEGEILLGDEPPLPPPGGGPDTQPTGSTGQRRRRMMDPDLEFMNGGGGGSGDPAGKQEGGQKVPAANPNQMQGGKYKLSKPIEHGRRQKMKKLKRKIAEDKTDWPCATPRPSAASSVRPPMGAQSAQNGHEGPSPAFASTPAVIYCDCIHVGVSDPQGTTPNRAESPGAKPTQAAPQGAMPNAADPHGAKPTQAAPQGAMPNAADPHGAMPIQAGPRDSAPIQANAGWKLGRVDSELVQGLHGATAEEGALPKWKLGRVDSELVQGLHGATAEEGALPNLERAVAGLLVGRATEEPSNAAGKGGALPSLGEQSDSLPSDLPAVPIIENKPLQCPTDARNRLSDADAAVLVDRMYNKLQCTLGTSDRSSYSSDRLSEEDADVLVDRMYSCDVASLDKLPGSRASGPAQQCQAVMHPQNSCDIACPEKLPGSRVSGPAKQCQAVIKHCSGTLAIAGIGGASQEAGWKVPDQSAELAKLRIQVRQQAGLVKLMQDANDSLAHNLEQSEKLRRDFTARYAFSIVDEKLRRDFTARYAFSIVDEDHDGFIRTDQVALLDLFHSWAPQVLELALMHFRSPLSYEGFIGEDGLVSFVQVADGRASLASLRYWFRVLDLDADGVVGPVDAKWFYNAVVEIWLT